MPGSGGGQGGSDSPVAISGHSSFGQGWSGRAAGFTPRRALRVCWRGLFLRTFRDMLQTALKNDVSSGAVATAARRVAWTSPGGKRRPLPWSVVHAPTQPTRARHPRRDRSGATCAAPGATAGEEEPRDPATISSGRPVPPRPSRRTLRRCGRSSRPRRGSASTSARRGARRASGSIRSSRT